MPKNTTECPRPGPEPGPFAPESSAITLPPRVTKNNRKNPEYHVVDVIRRLLTGKTVPKKKSWPNHVKNKQHIGSKKTYGPKNTEKSN